jgi:hypothetical protein
MSYGKRNFSMLLSTIEKKVGICNTVDGTQASKRTVMGSLASQIWTSRPAEWSFESGTILLRGLR